MEDWEAEAVEYLEQLARDDRRRILREVFHDPCEAEQDLVLHPLKRYFYACKIWICALLNRRRSYGWEDDTVDVMTFESSSSGYGWHARWAAVGYGIFRGWAYDVQEDGESYM